MRIQAGCKACKSRRRPEVSLRSSASVRSVGPINSAKGMGFMGALTRRSGQLCGRRNVELADPPWLACGSLAQNGALVIWTGDARSHSYDLCFQFVPTHNTFRGFNVFLRGLDHHESCFALRLVSKQHRRHGQRNEWDGQWYRNHYRHLFDRHYIGSLLLSPVLIGARILPLVAAALTLLLVQKGKVNRGQLERQNA